MAVTNEAANESSKLLACEESQDKNECNSTSLNISTGCHKAYCCKLLPKAANDSSKLLA